MKRLIHAALGKLGYRLEKIQKTRQHVVLKDMDPDFEPLFEKYTRFTMTSAERLFALYKAMQYVIRHNIPGDIVECGVWKGGSMMLCADMLCQANNFERKIYLYDTFSGMPEPSTKDINRLGLPAFEKWSMLERDDHNEWAYASLEEVQENMQLANYPGDKLVFVKGKVEDTIPNTAPDTICLLRLDTDWYESTYHELCHLFPRLSFNGVLILDDYGHWAGARQAIDEFFAKYNTKILLNRVDYTGRVGLKSEQ